MKLNHQDLLSSSNHLFHVSEEAGIARFDPRPSPTELPGIAGNVVFAISGHLLHNYLLPRDCPRVTFYASEKTTPSDKNYFFGNSNADFVIIAESNWYQRIKAATLYRYEFSPEGFSVIDEVAGYSVSYKPVILPMQPAFLPLLKASGIPTVLNTGHNRETTQPLIKY